MTTTQVAPDDLRVFPPPCSVENPADLNAADLPANQDNITDDATSIVIPSSGDGHVFAANIYQQDELRGGNKVELSPVNKVEPERGTPPQFSSPVDHEQRPFPASAYHVPPEPFTPHPRLGQPDRYFERAKRLGPLPGRCQFMFSDGRQCTMARSDIHPALCVYHSDREEQLFGDPSYRCETRKLDFPELYSASRDLSTAAGVNRALAQVFRLLAQRRISRQEAATFAKLGHLLLQSIRAARAELVDALPDGPAQDEDSGVILSESASAGESHGHQELSSLKKVESKDLSASPPHNPSSHLPAQPSAECVIPKTSSPISAPTFAHRVEIGRSGEDEESRAGSPAHADSACVGVQSRRRNGVQHGPASRHFPPDAPAEAISALRINTSVASVRNSSEISTSENPRDQVMQNQHL
jgi:hypothetical protein